MKAGRRYNADSKDLEKYHLFGMDTCDKLNRTPLWMVSMTLSMQSRSTSEAEVGSVRARRSVVG